MATRVPAEDLQGEDPGLGGAVGQFVVVGLDGIFGRDQDEPSPPTLAQRGKELPGDADGAEQVGFDGVHPSLIVDLVEQPGRTGDTGAVHEDVDVTHYRLDLVVQRLERFRAADVSACMVDALDGLPRAGVSLVVYTPLIALMSW